MSEHQINSSEIKCKQTYYNNKYVDFILAWFLLSCCTYVNNQALQMNLLVRVVTNEQNKK